MTINLFKHIPVALATVVFASAHAGMDMDSRVTQLEQQMAQVRSENSMDGYGAVLAPASPEVNGAGYFVEFSVLYEQPRFGGSEYAYSDADSAINAPIRGNVKDVRPNWQFGVEAAIGLVTNHDNWEVLAQYTYLGTSGSSHLNAGLNNAIIQMRADQNLTVPAGVLGQEFNLATKASATVDWQYNLLSAGVAKDYFLSKTFAIRSFGGLSSTWISMKENVSYTGGSTLGVNSVYVKDKNTFWGIGPVGGMTAKLFLGYGFSLYGDLTGTLFFGNFDVTHTETYSNAPTVGLIDLSADLHRFVPQIQSGVGLAFDKYFNDNRDHIMVSLGYDTTYLVRLNQMIKSNDNVVERYSEDATIQGAKLTIRWDF